MTIPRTTKVTTNTNEIKFEDDVEEEDKDIGEEEATPKWVKGVKKEDNKRYRELLQYMEEKRPERD